MHYYLFTRTKKNITKDKHGRDCRRYKKIKFKKKNLKNLADLKAEEHRLFIIVLGAPLQNQNLTVAVRQRIRAGVEVAKKALQTQRLYRILVSGTVDQTALMQQRLKELGMTGSRIQIESNATNTIEHAIFSKSHFLQYKKHVKKNTHFKIIIVTSQNHVTRAKWLFQRVYPKQQNIVVVGVQANVLSNEEKKMAKLKLLQQLFK